MLAKYQGKMWKITKKNYRKVLFRIALNKPFDMSEFAKEAGDVKLDIDRISQEEALNALDVAS